MQSAADRQQAEAERMLASAPLSHNGGDAIDTATSNRLFPFQKTSVRDFIAAQLAAARG